MPKIQCFNFANETIQSISTNLTTDLANQLNISRDRFSFPMPVKETVIKDGEIIEPPKYIKVTWAERPQDVALETADIIKSHFKNSNITGFTIYFENIFMKVK